MILSILDFKPEIHERCWIAKNATVAGRVSIKENANVWFHAMIRGDVNHIYIGAYTNIQDGAVVHGSQGKQDTVIGDYVTIGHRAIIHGCYIHDYSLIGMGAIVLDDAVVPSNCIVGAGAVVTQGKQLESGWVYAGAPAKKIKPIQEDAKNKIFIPSATGYAELAKIYHASGG